MSVFYKRIYMRTPLIIFLSATIFFANAFCETKAENIKEIPDETTAKKILLSVERYLMANPISPSRGLLQENFMCKVQIEDPPCLLVKENGCSISSVILSITQNNSDVYSMFLIKEKNSLLPPEVSLAYTCDPYYTRMPAYILFCDVVNYLPMLKKQPPEGFRVHISKTKVHKSGNYVQEWNFFTKTESLKEEIVFVPDGVGGTFFFYIGENNKFSSIEKDALLEKGMNAIYENVHQYKPPSSKTTKPQKVNR